MTALSTAPATAEVVVEDAVVTSSKARKTLAIARLATGFIFLWAFLDKTFGLGYSTPSENAWINGGKPSQGFLGHVEVGPFQDFFQSIASPATDVLFMLGMLGVGLAVMLGIGTRVAAVSGSIIMVMMWMAEWPLAKGSTNPLVDYHVIYALVLILVAFTFGGDTWGLGKWWKSLPVVNKNRWLI